MQLAETLGISYDLVHPMVADTDSVSYTDVTGGSRTTFATGLAVIEAGEEIKKVMLARGAAMLGVPAEELVYEDGEVRSTRDTAKRLTFKQIAEKQGQTGGPIVGKGSLSARGVGAAFGTHIVDVEVDPDTGKVTVLRYTAVQDVGTAVHPSYVEGQIQGGVAQGVGWALNEEYYYGEDGRLQNASYLDYRMPTTLDLPMIETVLVEVPNPGHPYGVRGVGEVPIVPPLAAVANAVADATGHRFTELPLSPRRLVEELHGLA
jgi:CO/xanthine dehydrogenase Mo-binding subunit